MSPTTRGTQASPRTHTHTHTRQIKVYLFQTLLPNADSVALYHIAHIPVITYSHKICRWDAFFFIQQGRHFDPTPAGAKKKTTTLPSHSLSVESPVIFTDHSDSFLKVQVAKFYVLHAVPTFWCSPPRICLCLGDRIPDLWLDGWGWQQGKLLCSSFFPAACRAPLLFLSSPLYVHPDTHPQAACLSLFLLKLSSEVSEGLALLIPDSVNEKQASYTGRLTARKRHAHPPSRPAMWNSLMVYITSEGFSPVFLGTYRKFPLWKKKPIVIVLYKPFRFPLSLDTFNKSHFE